MSENTNINIMIKARDQASARLKRVGKSVQSLGGIMRQAATVAAGYLGARAMVNFGRNSVAAFQRQEMAVNSLNAALKNLGQEGQTKQMQDFAASVQQVTTMGDEATMEIMALGASMGGMSGGQLQAATQAAIGFSHAYGMDVKTAMTLVSKAAQGNTASMSRYGIVFEEGMSRQEKFQMILNKGAEGFKLAQAETDTVAGKMKQLSNTWGDFKEIVGEAISKYIPGIVDGFKLAMVAIENWQLTMKIAWDTVRLGLISFWQDIKHFLGSTIPTLMQWFAGNWRQIFTDIWNGTKAVFVNMYKNAVDFFAALFAWMEGDGFNFQWTGLLDGFKSTLKEMPNIAKRQMSDTEKAMTGELNGLYVQFAQKLMDKSNPDYNAQAVAAAAAGAGLPGGIGGAGSTLSKAAGGGNANGAGGVNKSARFITLRAGAGVDKTEQNTARTVKVLEKIEKHLAKADVAANPIGAKVAVTKLT